MKFLLSFFILFFTLTISSQEASVSEKELSVSPNIDGTLLLPGTEKPKLAILIAGSGPTDRDGNQNFLKNNALKKLAEALVANNIASFRYDKRIVKQIRQGDVDKEIVFDDFVKDAKDVIAYFKESNEFAGIYVVGHSQGSLVGMLAAKDIADGFISLAGAGKNIGDVIIDQIALSAPQFIDDGKRVISILKQGKTTDDFPTMLSSVFNKGVQSFMISWMAYEPTQILKELDMPILIVNGEKDLQVSVEEAKLLHSASKNSELKLIEKMNHVLFIIEGDRLENSKSYNEPFRPIAQELARSITSFIHNN